MVAQPPANFWNAFSVLAFFALRLAEPRSDVWREMHLGFYFDFNTEEKLTVMFYGEEEF